MSLNYNIIFIFFEMDKILKVIILISDYNFYQKIK